MPCTTHYSCAVHPNGLMPASVAQSDLSWIAHPTGDQEVMGLIPADSGYILS